MAAYSFEVDPTPRKRKKGSSALQERLRVTAAAARAARPLSREEWAGLSHVHTEGELPEGSALPPADELHGRPNVPKDLVELVAKLQAKAAQAEEEDRPEEDEPAVLAELDDEEDLALTDDPLGTALRDLAQPESVFELEPPPDGSSPHQVATFRRNQALQRCLELDDRMLELRLELKRIDREEAEGTAGVGGDRAAFEAALVELEETGARRRMRRHGVEAGILSLWRQRRAAQAVFVAALREMTEAQQAKLVAEAVAKLKKFHELGMQMLTAADEVRQALMAIDEGGGTVAWIDIASAFGPRFWIDAVQCGGGVVQPSISPDYVPSAEGLGDFANGRLQELVGRSCPRIVGFAERSAAGHWLIMPDQKSWATALASGAYRHGRGEVERKRATRAA